MQGTVRDQVSLSVSCHKLGSVPKGRLSEERGGVLKGQLSLEVRVSDQNQVPQYTRQERHRERQQGTTLPRGPSFALEAIRQSGGGT